MIKILETAYKIFVFLLLGILAIKLFGLTPDKIEKKRKYEKLKTAYVETIGTVEKCAWISGTMYDLYVNYTVGGKTYQIVNSTDGIDREEKEIARDFQKCCRNDDCTGRQIKVRYLPEDPNYARIKFDKTAY